MLKKLAIGFIVLLAVFVVWGFRALTPDGIHVPATPTTELAPVDHALGLCEAWTEKNSKLAVGEFGQEHEIVGAKLPANHHLIEVEYRSKGVGLLMKTRCEYVSDGRPAFLVKAESSLQ